MIVIASAILGLLLVVVLLVVGFLHYYRNSGGRNKNTDTEIIVVLKEGETLDTLPIDKTNIGKTMNTFGKVMFSLRLSSYDDAEQTMEYLRSLPQVQSVDINHQIYIL
jgi:hypothetical protein